MEHTKQPRQPFMDGGMDPDKLERVNMNKLVRLQCGRDVIWARVTDQPVNGHFQAVVLDPPDHTEEHGLRAGDLIDFPARKIHEFRAMP